MPESWRENKAAGNDWWLGLIKKKWFIPHFLAANSNAPKPCLTVACGNCATRIREIWVFRSATVVVNYYATNV